MSRQGRNGQESEGPYVPRLPARQLPKLPPGRGRAGGPFNGAPRRALRRRRANAGPERGSQVRFVTRPVPQAEATGMMLRRTRSLLRAPLACRTMDANGGPALAGRCALLGGEAGWRAACAEANGPGPVGLPSAAQGQARFVTRPGHDREEPDLNFIWDKKVWVLVTG